jgi:lactate racemase
MIKQRQSRDDYLSEEEVGGFIESGCDSLPLSSKRVLVIVPDSTRTIPLPMIVLNLRGSLQSKVAQLDFIIALGTHPPMSEHALSQ